MVARRPRQGWFRRTWVIVAVVAVIVIGAGATITADLLGAFKPSPGPGPSPSSDNTLIAVRQGAWLTGMSIRFVDLDGAEVLTVKPTTPKGEDTFVRFVGDRALFVERVVHANETGKTTSYDYMLKALHRDGTVETLMKLGAETYQSPHLGNWVFSPDGNQWLWTQWTYNDATGSLHSDLHLSSLTGSDRVIEALDSTASRIVVGYSWNEGGPLVVHQVWGVGSSFPLGFSAMGDVYLLNPVSGGLSLLWPEASPCKFYARAVDGTIACIEERYTLRIGKPPNLALSIPLDRTRFAGSGSIEFKPGPEATLLSIDGCALTEQGAWYNCSTDLVDTRTGDIRRFGPDGLTASGWLADGSLLAHNIPNTDSADQTEYVYVVSPSGQARKLATGSPAGIWQA